MTRLSMLLAVAMQANRTAVDLESESPQVAASRTPWIPPIHSIAEIPPREAQLDEATCNALFSGARDLPDPDLRTRLMHREFVEAIRRLTEYSADTARIREPLRRGVGDVIPPWWPCLNQAIDLAQRSDRDTLRRLRGEERDVDAQRWLDLVLGSEVHPRPCPAPEDDPVRMNPRSPCGHAAIGFISPVEAREWVGCNLRIVLAARARHDVGLLEFAPRGFQDLFDPVAAAALELAYPVRVSDPAERHSCTSNPNPTEEEKLAARRSAGMQGIGYLSLLSFGAAPRILRSRAQHDRLLDALDDPDGWRRKHAWMSLSFLATARDLDELRARRDALRQEAPPDGVARSFEQLEELPERWIAERVVARLELFASGLGRERRCRRDQPLALEPADDREWPTILAALRELAEARPLDALLAELYLHDLRGVQGPRSPRTWRELLDDLGREIPDAPRFRLMQWLLDDGGELRDEELEELRAAFAWPRPSEDPRKPPDPGARDRERVAPVR